MCRKLKKYFPILSVIILLGFAFLPGLFSSAQAPAFEIYGSTDTCNNIQSYPLVENVKAVVFGDFTTITARVCDVSGVIRVIASIEDPNSGIPGETNYVNFAMSDKGESGDGESGDGIWGIIIDTTDNTRINWDANSLYYINIAVTDTLFNTNVNRSTGEFYNYEQEAYFIISGAAPVGITDFESSASSVQSGETVNLSANLVSLIDGSPVVGEAITFTDTTDSIDIGSGVTDGTGKAELSYFTRFDASDGVHELRATYGGTSETITLNITQSVSTTVELWADDINHELSSANPYSSVYNTYYKEVRDQFIITAFDLGPGAGLISGDIITGIQLKAASVSTFSSLDNFRIRMKQIGSQQETATWELFTATYYGPTDVLTSSLTAGQWRDYPFNSTAGFQWDGTSNIMVDIVRSNPTYTDSGSLWWRTGVGTNRTFAGYTDTLNSIYDNIGGTSGSTSTSCPALKVNYVRPVVSEIATEISALTVSAGSALPGDTVSLSATLKNISGSALPGEIIYFVDTTQNIDIGLATTNTSGIAQIDYPTVLGSSIGAHEIKAYYLGNGSNNFLSSDKTATLNIVSSLTVELWQSLSSDNYGYTQYNHAYNVQYLEARNQFIISKSDLSGIGMLANNKITGIQLRANSRPTVDLANFRIRMKNIPVAQTTTASWESFSMTYFGPTTVAFSTIAVGEWKEYSGFQWDGTGNVMVDISRKIPTSGNNNGSFYWKVNVGANRSFSGYGGLNTVYSGTGGTVISSAKVPDVKITYTR